MQSALTEIFGDVISSYTRGQAVEDGVLIDVTEMAREAGITLPVVVTARLWAEVITPDPRSVPYGQSIEGRLWDTLSMLKYALMTGHAQAGYMFHFSAYYIMKARQRRLLKLKAFCGPYDSEEPGFTIMLPNES